MAYIHTSHKYKYIYLIFGSVQAILNCLSINIYYSPLMIHGKVHKRFRADSNRKKRRRRKKTIINFNMDYCGAAFLHSKTIPKIPDTRLDGIIFWDWKTTWPNEQSGRRGEALFPLILGSPSLLLIDVLENEREGWSELDGVSSMFTLLLFNALHTQHRSPNVLGSYEGVYKVFIFLYICVCVCLCVCVEGTLYVFYFAAHCKLKARRHEHSLHTRYWYHIITIIENHSLSLCPLILHFVSLYISYFSVVLFKLLLSFVSIGLGFNQKKATHCKQPTFQLRSNPT